ncbi:MAG: ROK family protein [Candidatus Woesearchaeota archaeon]
MAVISLDIGGTKIKGAVITPSYRIVKSIKVPTRPNKGKRYILDTIKTIINSLSSESKHKITAIGVSMAGSLDMKGRLVDLENTIPALQYTYIKRFFSRSTKLPVVIENDANCFTLAESVMGEAHDKRVTIGIIWGTGIGAGLVTQELTGRPAIYKGVSGSGLEIGHNKVYSQAFGKYIPLEKIAGGKYLPTVYKRFGGEKNLTPSEILKGKDSASKKATTECLTQIGLSIGGLINTFNPDSIVIGGGLSNLYDSLHKRLIAKVKRFAVKEHFDNVTFSKFSLSDDEGIMGAAYLAFKKTSKK